jgi:phage FluMu gp28-like protein
MRATPLVVELRKVPFEQQKQIAFFILDRLPRRGAAKLDARGNGQYLAEVVMQRYGEDAVECVMLSQAWYRDNMPKLKDCFESRYIALTADDYLVSDVCSIRLVRGVPMVPDNYKGEDRDGGERHGDFAPSLALAHAASLVDVMEIAFQSTGDGRATDALGRDLGIDEDKGFGIVTSDFDMGDFV